MGGTICGPTVGKTRSDNIKRTSADEGAYHKNPSLKKIYQANGFVQSKRVMRSEIQATRGKRKRVLFFEGVGNPRKECCRIIFRPKAKGEGTIARLGTPY